MTGTSAAIPSLTIMILSSQYLVRLGIQNLLESRATIQMVVHPHHWRTVDRFPTEPRPDVVILDLETVRDAIDTINQIRESVPTSKIVLLGGLDDTDRLREAFVASVDGIMLKVQPPAVVLAVIEALYAPATPQAHKERERAGEMGLGTPFTKKGEADPQPTAWPDALTEREHDVIRLVGQGLSNKDIADKLSISDSTVRYHMTNIFDKVGVPNRQKLLLHAHHVLSTPG